MPKSATSKPSGYGGRSERPFTWWVAPVRMGSSRPGSASSAAGIWGLPNRNCSMGSSVLPQVYACPVTGP